jgi:hypothetical protein
MKENQILKEAFPSELRQGPLFPDVTQPDAPDTIPDRQTKTNRIDKSVIDSKQVKIKGWPKRS